MLDIGANIGDYTKLLASNFPQAQILSFEINPLSYKELKKIETMHTNIQTFNFGLSNEQKTITIFDYSNISGSGHTSIYKDVLTHIHKADDVLEIKSHVQIGDNFIASEIKINKLKFIKIDTEGHELEIIKGLIKSIEKFAPIIQFEFNEMNVISRAHFTDIKNVLTNYNFFRLLPHGMLQINDLPIIMQELYAYQNIIAIPDLIDTKEHFI